ncbi:sulfatase [Spirochaetia bacterium]|nr:sulfatase [Spirochaetia bacterium]
MTNYVDGKTGRGPYRCFNTQRPNILMISFDMVPREFYLPREGDLAPRTPHLDKLKAEGLFFSNAYATSPLCSPSRASLFTGRYPYIVANGERSHDGQQEHIREGDTICPEYLKAAGYRTRHFGKCHVGAAKFLSAFGENDSPWDRWSPPWRDDDGYREFLRDKGIKDFQFNREIRGNAPSGKGKGNFLGGWVCTDQGAPFPKDAVYPAYISARAIAGLKTYENDPRPFYFQIDFFEPHQPFFIPSGYESREQELRSALVLPRSWESAMQGCPAAPLPLVYDRYRRYWGLQDQNTAEDYLVANVLQYEILDEQVGRIIEQLKVSGAYERTMIILTADHGEMNCRDGLVDKGAYLNPRVLQVPLYLKLPAGGKSSPESIRRNPPPGTVIDRLSSLMDIAPTILAAAGIEAQDRFDGRSLLEEGTGKRKLLAEVFAHVVPNPAACLIREESGETTLYTVNFADSIDEYYRRCPGGSWDEKNQAGQAAGQEEILREMLAFFEADERWSAYGAYFRLIHADKLGTAADLQKFVSV